MPYPGAPGQAGEIMFFNRVNGKCQFEGVRNEKDRINFDVVDGIVGIWL